MHGIHLRYDVNVAQERHILAANGSYLSGSNEYRFQQYIYYYQWLSVINSVIDWQEWTGRAGRAGLPDTCLMTD